MNVNINGSNVGNIVVNGKAYSGRNVSVVNGVVIIDGKAQDGTVSGVVEVRVTGDLVNVWSDASVTVTGNVDGDVDAGNSVTVTGFVAGNIDAGNSVTVGGDVHGDISAGNKVTVHGVRL